MGIYLYFITFLLHVGVYFISAPEIISIIKPTICTNFSNLFLK